MKKQTKSQISILADRSTTVSSLSCDSLFVMYLHRLVEAVVLDEPLYSRKTCLRVVVVLAEPLSFLVVDLIDGIVVLGEDIAPVVLAEPLSSLVVALVDGIVVLVLAFLAEPL